ncbi:MAG: sigma-70 family RNA polymerase sigma factor [Bacteroidia bacterium]
MNNTASQLAQWLDEHGDALYQYARLKTGDADLAADLVQDTFEAALNNLHRFKAASKPRTWLFGILRNKIMDHFRKQYREMPQSTSAASDSYHDTFSAEGHWQAHSAPLPPEPELLDQPAFIKVLYACLTKLPELWRAVLESKYLENKDTAELCQDLNISTTNYWQINHRAKVQMQQCLQANWFKKQ